MLTLNRKVLHEDANKDVQWLTIVLPDGKEGVIYFHKGSTPNQVKVSLDFPDEYRIYRKEVWDKIKREQFDTTTEE